MEKCPKCGAELTTTGRGDIVCTKCPYIKGSVYPPEKYTSGPWKLVISQPDKTKLAKYEIWGGKDSMHLICRFDPVGNENNTTNGRLIAAAPSLLEACKAIYHDAINHQHRHNTIVFPRRKDAIIKLEQAILRFDPDYFVNMGVHLT